MLWLPECDQIDLGLFSNTVACMRRNWMRNLILLEQGITDRSLHKHYSLGWPITAKWMQIWSLVGHDNSNSQVWKRLTINYDNSENVNLEHVQTVKSYYIWKRNLKYSRVVLSGQMEGVSQYTAKDFTWITLPVRVHTRGCVTELVLLYVRNTKTSRIRCSVVHACEAFVGSEYSFRDACLY